MRNSIYIHIPRTAGRSIQKILQRSGRRQLWDAHHSAEEWKAKTRGKWDESFKFAFVRNPWSRMLSLYLHVDERRAKYLRGNAVVPESFPKWVESIKNFEMIFGDIKGFGHQDLYYKIDGAQCLDFVGKYENLEGDLAVVTDNIGVSFENLRRVGKTKHSDYHEYYTDEMRDLVADYEKEVILDFGYEF